MSYSQICYVGKRMNDLDHTFTIFDVPTHIIEKTWNIDFFFVFDVRVVAIPNTWLEFKHVFRFESVFQETSFAGGQIIDRGLRHMLHNAGHILPKDRKSSLRFESAQKTHTIWISAYNFI